VRSATATSRLANCHIDISCQAAQFVVREWPSTSSAPFSRSGFAPLTRKVTAPGIAGGSPLPAPGFSRPITTETIANLLLHIRPPPSRPKPSPAQGIE
jgi:hypothetical protein